MVQESAYLSALTRAVSFSINGNRLILADGHTAQRYYHSQRNPDWTCRIAGVHDISASLKACGRSDLEVERRRCKWFYCGFGPSLNDY